MKADWHNAIVHLGAIPYVSNPHPALGETVRIRLRSAPSAPIRAIYLRTFPDGEQAFAQLQVAEKNETALWWQAHMEINQPREHYRFLVVSEAGVFYLTAAGLTHYNPLDHTDFKLIADYKAPDWFKTAVFYQIFPDRFANGDPSTNPQPDEPAYLGKHPQTYPWESAPDADQPFPIVFYGGDLPGITQKLDYLADLGVNTLYLNPIFTAQSNHKYDVSDYENVDPHFGGNEALVDLKSALADRGMRYLLDIVPNHCGYLHPWFLTAQADSVAPEAEFFTFTQHPEHYISWLNVKSLPKLNYQSQNLRQKMYGTPESVMQRWLRPPFKADGWRVDVANMLGRQGKIQIGAEVKREIRTAVKSANPEAYLMGENFFDGSPALQGDMWDGNMNYAGFSTPLIHWLSGFYAGSFGMKERIISSTPWTTNALADAWQNYLAAIPWTIALQQFNVIGSHDVPRIRSVLSENDALHRLAVIVQFTFPGLPCIYYGDEIGMVDDPNLRQRGCMVWDETRWNHDLRSFFQALIKLRQESEALQTGGFQILAVEPDTIVYQRESASRRMLVVAHRGTEPRPERPFDIPQAGIPSGTRFESFFKGGTAVVENGQFQPPIQAQGASIWREIAG